MHSLPNAEEPTVIRVLSLENNCLKVMHLCVYLRQTFDQLKSFNQCSKVSFFFFCRLPSVTIFPPHCILNREVYLRCLFSALLCQWEQIAFDSENQFILCLNIFLALSMPLLFDAAGCSFFPTVLLFIYSVKTSFYG